jgi:hypothetical protein
MTVMAKDAPDMCANYALDNKLLTFNGWKQFCRRAKNPKVLERRVKRAKKQHNRHYTPVYMYGVEIPSDTNHAREINKANVNNKWVDAEKLELEQLFNYKFAIDGGFGDQRVQEYQRIRCRMISAVKHDGRFVDGGHLTRDPEESVYSSVVPLRSLRIILLAAESNALKLFQADVGSAYLGALLSREDIYFIGGNEFAAFGLEGHTIISHKALCGPKSSGKSWHLKFAETMYSLADPDVWMHITNTISGNMSVYVLMI